MIFANVRELKNNTSELLRATGEGNDVIITYHGKPKALLSPLNEENMEEYILNHPKMRALFEESYEEYKQYGGKKLGDFVEEIKQDELL
jgi:prevent-host-death family protein